jgi:tartrate-resistant acid phosphatase type 5
MTVAPTPRILSSLPALLLLAYPQSAFAQTKFAVIGDYGNGPQAANVATLVKGQKVTFVVTVGDNCYGSSPGIATQVGNKYGTYVTNRDFWPSLGNHEYSDGCGGGSAKGYFAYFKLPNNERYYDVAIGPVHLFAINSNSQEPSGISSSSTQAQWLKKKLAAARQPWKIVYFHHPPYSSGEHGSTKALQWPFEAWGASLVLSGHDHDYERIQRDDNHDGKKLTYIVDGMGGEPPRSFSTTVAGSVFRYNNGNGALFATATNTTLSLEFRNTGGSVVDKVTLTK